MLAMSNLEQRSMDDEIERALTLSLAMSHVSRPENDRSSERLSDTGLREALEASLRDAQEDDSATQRAIELAMAESLKHDDGDAPQHPDLDLGASGQGSCIEQPIDLASAPTDGSGALLPQVTAASAAQAPSSSADGNDAPPEFRSLDANEMAPPVFGSLSADEEAAVFRSLSADDPPPPAFGSFGADDPPPPAFGSLGPPPDDVVPVARPFRYDEGFDGGGFDGAVHPPSSSAPAPAPASEPSRGWVCVCDPDEMAHFFAREAFLVPAALRATAGMAQPGEPLFLLSKFDGMLRGNTVKVPPWQCPRSAPAPPQGAPGSSGWPGAPRGETGPLGAQPLPRVLWSSRSKAAGCTAFDTSGGGEARAEGTGARTPRRPEQRPRDHR